MLCLAPGSNGKMALKTPVKPQPRKAIILLEARDLLDLCEIKPITVKAGIAGVFESRIGTFH
jgi:hypothetical protein